LDRVTPIRVDGERKRRLLWKASQFYCDERSSNADSYETRITSRSFLYGHRWPVLGMSGQLTVALFGMQIECARKVNYTCLFSWC